MLVRMLRLARLARAVRLMVPWSLPNNFLCRMKFEQPVNWTQKSNITVTVLFWGDQPITAVSIRNCTCFASSTGWVGQILAFWLFMLLKCNFWHLCFSSLFRSQIIVGANWNCMGIFSQVQFKTLWQLVQGLFHSFWERKFRRLFFLVSAF